MNYEKIFDAIERNGLYWSFGKHQEFGYQLRIYSKSNLKITYIKIFVGKTLDECLLDFVDYITSVGGY